MKLTRALILSLTTGTLLTALTPCLATDTDERIETAAKDSYVFKTYLKNDAEKSLVTKSASDIVGVVRVINNMTIGVPVAKR